MFTSFTDGRFKRYHRQLSVSLRREISFRTVANASSAFVRFSKGLESKRSTLKFNWNVSLEL
jgi:hypothetical protein